MKKAKKGVKKVFARTTNNLRNFNPMRIDKVVIMIGIVAFAVVGGVIMLFATRAATSITINNSLPNPTNVRAFGDDRVITVSWDAPSNASSHNIVGYYITWGKASNGGIYTNAKQSTHTITQLQPVDNGASYNIKVQSVQGTYAQEPTPGAMEGSSAREARANGQASPGATTTATPSSARVDELRQQMTGFFDDFNTPLGDDRLYGPFDELKWNQAGSSCGAVGTAAAFLNNQFHAHNQISTIAPPGSSYCDRGQFVTRARGVFDIAGRTEASPGVIAFDMDGATQPRDVWYLDLIPFTARTNGAPVDVTAHANIFDDEPSDPMGIRVTQSPEGVQVHYYDNNKTPSPIMPTFECSGPGGQHPHIAYLSDCNAGNKVSGLSPLTQPSASLQHVPNVRRAWRVHITNSTIKIFVDSVRVWEGPIPADFRNITKYQVHSTLFAYNTGKENYDNPMTFLFHWDNFGFNGPAAPTVVHNYQEGGPNGSMPFLGRGTVANSVPTGSRSTIIKIPDQIGNPVKARIYFTLTAFGPGSYRYNSANNVIRINGNAYPLSHPRNYVPQPVWSLWQNGNSWDATTMGNGNNPMAFSIDINPAHLVGGVGNNGNNQLQLGIDGDYQAYMNVHIELEYTPGTQPTYTQPKDIFNIDTFVTATTPILSKHDKYMFQEQDMGLQSGTIASTPGGTGDTTAPTVSITAPTSGTTITKNNPINLVANATDNVAVDKVEVYMDGQRIQTLTHSPWSIALPTTDLTAASHAIFVRAFDAANNQTSSNTINVTIANPAPVAKNGDVNGDNIVGILDLSIILGNWNRTSMTRAQGDLTGDGRVNVNDLSAVLGNWGR